MGFEDKVDIVKDGDNLLRTINREPDNLTFLRAYNAWYTSALEFVQYQAESRLKEFEDLHSKSQSLLCQLKPDLQQVTVNLTIQIAIIEGSKDHDIHFTSMEN